MAQAVRATLYKAQARNSCIAPIRTMAGRSNTLLSLTTERSVQLVYTQTTTDSTRFLMILWKYLSAMEIINSNINPHSPKITNTPLLLGHKTTIIPLNKAINHKCSCQE